jgi:hypothetical protein
MINEWSKSPRRENQLLSHLKAVLKVPTAIEHAESTFFYGREEEKKASLVGKHKKQARLAMNGSFKAVGRIRENLIFVEW